MRFDATKIPYIFILKSNSMFLLFTATVPYICDTGRCFHASGMWIKYILQSLIIIYLISCIIICISHGIESFFTIEGKKKKVPSSLLFLMESSLCDMESWSWSELSLSSSLEKFSWVCSVCSIAPLVESSSGFKFTQVQCQISQNKYGTINES